MELRSKSSVYKIQKILSEKETSTVCEAYRKDLKYPVSQKILLKIFKSKSHIYPLELDSLIKVRSPYCTSVLNFETIENKPAFILEWITGLNLFQLLRQSKRLNPLEISYICWNVQQGLQDLRNHGIFHGDLSFSNILIDQKGNIRLIDFGKGNYTGKHIFTTPCFTAPEISQGQPPSFYSDLFSLGVLEVLLNQPIQYWDESQWGSRFAVLGDPLLDPYPKRRRMKEFIYDESAKKSLAQKVGDILKEQDKKVIPFPAKKTTSNLLLKLKLGFSFLIFFFIGQPEVSIGSLSIRSHQWLQVQVANQNSFTPFNSGPLSAGTYSIRWKTRDRSGSTSITVKKNQHLLLTDKDFISTEKSKK